MIVEKLAYHLTNLGIQTVVQQAHVFHLTRKLNSKLVPDCQWKAQFICRTSHAVELVNPEQICYKLTFHHMTAYYLKLTTVNTQTLPPLSKIFYG